MRRAIITGGADSLEQVQRYMPGNYDARFEVQFFDAQPVQVMVIVGEDNAGWTLEDYVIPRLASGLIGARVEE
ncbi:hypothetical protein LCGC14_1334080 [marine sediment metagenome]|uniref:Uncharacterized protein n=1 Tax=marine sediment metagenome TaxID=412755 RepID=A0A0F9NI67_9ZZZZ